MIPSMTIPRCRFQRGCFKPGSLALAVASVSDVIERLRWFSTWFGARMVRQFGDLRYSLAQVDLDADMIALGNQLFVQHIGVGHWQRPGLPVPRLECDRPLGLINTHDRARA